MFFVEDLYNTLRGSQYFELMTKEAKRNFNEKKFNIMLDENLFLKAIIKPRKATYKKVQQTKPFIVGYKLIVEKKDELDEETDEESLDL